MPSPGDPSFDRQQRAARAKQAASDASGERLAELREKYLAPTKPTTRATASRTSRTTRTPTPAAAPRVRVPSTPKVRPLDTAGIVRTARAALDKHPQTWTSYAELCSAMGMTRSSAGRLARQHVFERPGAHWFRVRNDDGVFEWPDAVEGNEGDPGVDVAVVAVSFDPDEADRELAGIGVAVVDGRADPDRKLGWNGSAWTLPGPVSE
ncbi:MAG: hypothetical protein ABW219_02390 [Ilumatobacteraceae bacterium]